MRNYATLFDRNYLPQGLALYESLVRHSSDQEFRVYVLALDEETDQTLDRLDLPGLVSVPLETFESAADLKLVRANRTYQEYCWSLASIFSDWLIQRYNEITYLDADCFFFDDPKIIFDEVGDRSIAIVPHRFQEKDRRRLEPNGLFNVSLVYFRGNIGRHCLKRWAEQCRQWCYYRNENGKFGDQAYLNEWPMLYGDDCCVIQNAGVGVAPWNVATWKVTDSPSANDVPICFYHFHEFKNEAHLTNWPLRPEDRKFIYAPYIEAVAEAKRRIES